MSEPHCKACNDTGSIVIRHGTHTDLVPCEKCLPPLNDCSRGHRLITYRGTPCPLCEVLQERRSNAPTAV